MHLSRGQGEGENQFVRLLRGWACDVPTAVERLRRIEVRTIGERDLERAVRWGVEALFVADPWKGARGTPEDC